MKLLLDEMWSPRIAIQLRAVGHDVIMVAERLDLRTQSDTTIFAFAQRKGRCVPTDNVGDFQHQATLANARGESHARLVFISSRRFSRHDARTPGRIIVALDHLLTSGLGLTDREHWLQ